jgi:alkyl hydroperoxide reductase subunit AhpC
VFLFFPTPRAAVTQLDHLSISFMAQEALSQQKIIRIGDVAPNFKSKTQYGEFDLYEYLGTSWGIFFSHPRDFTPVCTTELGRVAQLKEEWEKRNVKPVALSVDATEDHHKWIEDINETQCASVNFPIVADSDRSVSILYGMLDQTHLNQTTGMPFTVRSVFVIDPERKVRLILTYPASTGRNFNEILRVIDSLQLTSYHKVATPADWVKGKDTVVLPTVSDEDAQKLFPKGFTKVKSYLRVTPDPTA